MIFTLIWGALKLFSDFSLIFSLNSPWKQTLTLFGGLLFSNTLTRIRISEFRGILDRSGLHAVLWSCGFEEAHRFSHWTRLQQVKVTVLLRRRVERPRVWVLWVPFMCLRLPIENFALHTAGKLNWILMSFLFWLIFFVFFCFWHFLIDVEFFYSEFSVRSWFVSMDNCSLKRFGVDWARRAAFYLIAHSFFI